jgi:hypothetical protein
MTIKPSKITSGLLSVEQPQNKMEARDAQVKVENLVAQKSNLPKLRQEEQAQPTPPS